MGAFIDLTGRRFGKLLVLGRAERDSRGRTRYLCKCDCGNETIVQSSYLKLGDTKSCGCLKHQVNWRFDNLTGQTFGKLYVVKRVENDAQGTVQYLCRCECGNEKIVRANHLKRGAVRSCGCLASALTSQRNTTHNKTGTRLYRIWRGIKVRCYDAHHKDFRDYGAKGVTICDEWRDDFQAFYDWAMANGYEENLSIDRIDNSKGYSPDNCRWADNIQQANNKTTNYYVVYKNERLTLSELARKYHLNYTVLGKAIRAGKSLEEAVRRAEIKK